MKGLPNGSHCLPHEPEPGQVREEIQKSGGGVSGTLQWGTHEQEVQYRDPIYHLDSPINLPGTIQQHGENDAIQVDHVPGDKNPCDYDSKYPDLLPENLTREQREEIGIQLSG